MPNYLLQMLMDGSNHLIPGIARQDVFQGKVATVLGERAPVSPDNVQSLLLHNLQQS